MVDFLNGQERTNKCGELSLNDVGKKVVLMGWVHRRRDLGGLIFLQLRDISGIAQVVFDTDICDHVLLEKASGIKLEYVITVEGVVRQRTEGNVNKNMPTGEIEIAATSLKILSEAETTPFSVGDSNANELLRLKYRYLDLRRQKLQQNLIIRDKICKITRDYLSENGFLEIETPMLGKSTPEGARDYLVPSRVHPGTYYALPQSPQLYKQLLMIGGMDRYYQIARCFRDEDLRANRQPEFTQIDIEMSFIDKEQSIMRLVEGLVVRWFKEIKNIDIPTPFKVLSYNEAMDRFGSDKPDIRFEMEIQDISAQVSQCGFSIFEEPIKNGGSVRAIILRGREKELSRKEIDKLVDFVKTYKAKGLAWLGIGSDGIRSSFAKNLDEQTLQNVYKRLDMHEGDIMFAVADSNNQTVVTALGALRCNLASKFGLIDKLNYGITWIIDFPLFEYSDEEQRYVAKHHPFTSPKDEDLNIIKTHPEKARAKAYDLVINGDEMGGGSMRIYNKEVQTMMFEALGFTDEKIKEKFGYFVEAFNYGTPPHGGLAFGLDRLTMVFTESDNIKEVIAFPKLQNASCVMSDAPSEVDQNQLNDLCIRNVAKEQK